MAMATTTTAATDGAKERSAAGASGGAVRIERASPADCGQSDPEGACGGGDSGVRVLWLDSPPRNALTEALAGEFERACEELSRDPGLRALIVTGAGDSAFSAGADFGFLEDRTMAMGGGAGGAGAHGSAEQARARAVQGNREVLESFYKRFLRPLRRTVRAPTIAAINGAAVGGGAALAMAADVRIASTTSRLGFNFVRLGITPGMASTALLPSATGHQVACRLLLTGDLVDAAEAKRLGLVLDAVPPEELLPAARRLAGRIASASPAAVAATLELLRARDLPWDRVEAAAGAEAALQAEFILSPDARERIVDSVKKHKRAARFRGGFGADPGSGGDGQQQRG